MVWFHFGLAVLKDLLFKIRIYNVVNSAYYTTTIGSVAMYLLLYFIYTKIYEIKVKSNSYLLKVVFVLVVFMIGNIASSVNPTRARD